MAHLPGWLGYILLPKRMQGMSQIFQGRTVSPTTQNTAEATDEWTFHGAKCVWEGQIRNEERLIIMGLGVKENYVLN